jgi:hypothetical protein
MAIVRKYCNGNSGPASPGSGINNHIVSTYPFNLRIPVGEFLRASRKSPALHFETLNEHWSSICFESCTAILVFSDTKDKTKYLAHFSLDHCRFDTVCSTGSTSN